MKKFVIVSFLLVLFLTPSLFAKKKNMPLNDNTCYTISFATLAFSSVQIMGRHIALDEDGIRFMENGQAMAQLADVGYFIIQEPAEKCAKKTEPKLYNILKQSNLLKGKH